MAVKPIPDGYYTATPYLIIRDGSYLYVTDVDATYKKALAAGAQSKREPANQFYGDRVATVADRWGNTWSIGTHVEDVSPEEMQRRMKAQQK